jgi:hypothetical protein
MTIKHGASAYRNHACRCEVCATGHRERMADNKRRRRQARVFINGQWIAPLPDEQHGRYSTYTNHSCRCDRCYAVNSARAAEYYRRRASGGAA